MSSRLAALATSVVATVSLVAVAACTDADDNTKSPAELTAPRRSVSSAPVDSAEQPSTLCNAFRSELTRYEAALSANSSDAAAQRDVVAAQERVADTCQ